MKTLNKFRKNAKALSPVVASIILIAVTVAVSIAVAAWMGALTVGFMDTEQIEIRAISFDTDGEGVTLTVRNTGTSAVILREIWVNNVDQTANSNMTSTATVNANSDTSVVLATFDWQAGDNYQFKFVTSKNNPFMRNAIPPS